MTPNYIKDTIATIRKKAESLIPAHMVEGVCTYVEQGIPPGGFLRAVLENNLVQSAVRADLSNRQRLVEYAQLVYWELPSGCHGSKADVDDWVKSGGLAGMLRRADEIAREASTDVPGADS